MNLLPLLCLSLATFQDTPLVHSTFATGEDGWKAVQVEGTAGKLSVVRDPEHLKVGTGSLKLEYAVATGQISGATLPFADGTITKMGSIRFWVRPEGNVPLSILLTEKGGAQYGCVVSAAKGKWQEVVLAPEDFTLDVNANSPADANGKLDLDAIQSISLMDLEQMLGQNAALAGLLGIVSGPRALYLSDFQVSPKPIAASGPNVIDDFSRPQPNWAVLNATSGVVSEAPLNARALRMDYNLTSGKAAGALRPLRAGVLTGKRTIDFRIASANASRILVQLEETSGGKYNSIIELPAGSVAVDRSVDFTEMSAADDSKDDNGKLDLDRVKHIAFIDLTALIDAPGRNTLWIGRLTTHA